MLRPIATLAATLSACLCVAAAQGPDAAAAPPHEMTVWDNATAPHSNGLAGDGARATLHIYPADKARDTGLAVVVCPGGGYAYLAMDHEGHRVAEWLADNGVTAAVLRYRMPEGHPEVPLEDAERALRILMGLEAGATGYTPDRVGIMGFSAGGPLAPQTPATRATPPPDAVRVYPGRTRAPAAAPARPAREGRQEGRKEGRTERKEGREEGE